MNAQTTTQRVKNHYQRMKAKGFKNLKAWIPAEKEGFFKEVVKAIQEGRRVVIHNEESGKGDSGKLAPKPDNTHKPTD